VARVKSRLVPKVGYTVLPNLWGWGHVGGSVEILPRNFKISNVPTTRLKGRFEIDSWGQFELLRELKTAGQK